MEDEGKTTQNVSLNEAIAKFERSLGRLQNRVKSQSVKMQEVADLENQLQSLGLERANMATLLDNTAARNAQLMEANQQVSKRLFQSMSTLRAILDESKNKG